MWGHDRCGVRACGYIDSDADLHPHSNRYTHPYAHTDADTDVHVDAHADVDLPIVTPENFEQQMNALKDWGYNAIPISLLVKAITKGTELPLHPVVITFDDGDVSVFKNAFPIMKRFGFVGVVYIVGNRLEADGFMHPDQIKKLASRGWEVGSHSMTHTDLTFDHEALRHELADSKRLLEEKVGVHVDSFAYPFATIDPVTAQKAYEIGYTNAVGVGTFYTNDKYVLYYLNRLEIRYDYTLEKIASILPWPGAPTATPTP
jgi:peptidoglycan/xylan/chitin deacetylase (PgdA/CDA1 family)